MSRDPEAKADPRIARLYDKRTVERNIKKGLITRKDYEKHLKSLDDAGEKGVYGGPLEEPDEPDYPDEEVEDDEPEGGAAPDGNNSHS